MTSLTDFPIQARWPAADPTVIQLYSFPTPNGVKVSIALEEMGLAYEPHLVTLSDTDVKSPAFLSLNPNNKIPAIIDPNGPDGPIGLWESGAILLYLAEKFRAFIPKDIEGRTETLNWLFWLQGSAPYLGGGFGHFYAYAPEKFEYAINRFTMETKRQLDVLDKNLEDRRYLAGDAYTIADMATAPWYGTLVKGDIYNDAAEFIDAASYEHVNRWADDVMSRPAFKRGKMVNRGWGEENEQMKERHDASDFDKLG